MGIQKSHIKLNKLKIRPLKLVHPIKIFLKIFFFDIAANNNKNPIPKLLATTTSAVPLTRRNVSFEAFIACNSFHRKN